MSDAFQTTRRRLLACAGAPLLPGTLASLATPRALAADADPTVTVLYQRDSTSAAPRLDPAVQAATLAFEKGFLERGFRVLQPSAASYALLDQGPGVAVSFAPDAGFSLLFSVQKDIRPAGGLDQSVVEVGVRLRVFVAHSVLAAETATGRMVANTAPELRATGERRGAELAAQRAVTECVERVSRRLKSLTREEIAELSRLRLPADPSGQAIPVPAPLGAAPGPAGLPTPARRFALIITVADYGGVCRRLGKSDARACDLPGVNADREHLQAVLAARGFEVRMLSDAQATSTAVRQELKALVGRTRAEDMVLVAVSAHGAGASKDVPSGFGMPLLSDFAPGDPGLIDFWELQALVSRLPARQTALVIDTCHSGGATGLLVQAEISAQGVSVQQGRVTPDPARMAQAQNDSGLSSAFAVLAAARPEQISLDLGLPRGGLFMSTFLQALTADQGQHTLKALFTERIAGQVVASSRALCQQQGGCVEQTPMFAWSGLGDQIRL